MLMEQERIKIVEFDKRMSLEGLCRGTAGNISIYDPVTGYMAISPSGMDYFKTEPADIVVCDLEGNVIEGNRNPSSEYMLHTFFYKAKATEGCHSVVHTHSDYATTLASMGEPVRAVHYVIATMGTDIIPVAEYTTFGTPELAKLAVKTCKKGQAVLLANHGVVAFGDTIEKAFKNAGNVESLAKTQWQCMCAGKMNVLSEEQIAEVVERFNSYGQGTGKKESNSY